MDMSRYTWVIGFLGTVCLVLGSSVYSLLGTFEGPSLWLFIAGGALSLLYVAIERQNLKEAVSTPAFAFSGTSLVMQLVVGLIAIVIFVIADRSDTTFDLTTDGRHTLSEHARTVVSSLDEPVHVMAFFRNGTLAQEDFSRRMELFEQASGGKLTIEWIDPLSNPLKAEMNGVEGESGTVILTQGDRTQRLETDFDREDAFTKKLVVVQSDRDHRICWSVGHGEADPDDEFSPDGLGAIVLKLEGFNYQVTKSLVATEGIDRGCEVLVIARPAVEWLPHEKEALAAFVGEGGAVLVLIDTRQVWRGNQSLLEFQVPQFAADLERFGIHVGDDIVLDLDPSSTMMGVDDPSQVVIHGQGIVYHPVTQSLHAAVNLAISRSVTPMVGMDGRLAQSLLNSSAEAWAETDPNGALEPNEGLGVVSVAAVVEIVNPDVLAVTLPEADGDRGPLSPVMDIEANVGRAVPADYTPKSGGRMLVVGDADFANNTLLTRGNNADFFLNSLAWMVEEEGQIGERPAPGQALEVSSLGAGVLCLVSLGGVPGLAVLFATITLLRRRFL